MSQVIQFKRGTKANLPSSAAIGEPLWSTDTNELFVGTGTGVTPIIGVDENVKVGAAGAKDYLSESYFEQDATNHIRIKQDTLLAGVDADKVDGKNVDDSEVSTSYLWTAGKIITYVEQFANGLDWQNSVLSYTATPPVSPVLGDRYLVKATATGVFLGQEGKIAQYNGTAFNFVTPNAGFAVYIEDEGKQYTYNGTAWVNFGSTTNHNATSGLQGGTTSEYYHLTSAQHTGLTDGNATTLHKHNTDNLTEGTTNLFFTDARAISAINGIITDGDSIDFTVTASEITAEVIKQNSNSINLSIDASGLKADLNINDTNTIDLTVGASGLEADVKSQNTNSITIGSDASGLKADLVFADTNSIDLSVGVTGLTADVKKDNTDSVTLAIGATGLTASVNVDNSSVKIDATNHYIYVDTIDGGSF